MSGRKTKTERKRAKVAKKTAERRTEPLVFFEDALLAFLRSVGQAAGGIKNRGGGAQSLGPDGMYACAVEALDRAQNGLGAPEYISASAYALVAAMQAGGAWGLVPKPASEQPSEPQETPPDEAERGSE